MLVDEKPLHAAGEELRAAWRHRRGEISPVEFLQVLDDLGNIITRALDGGHDRIAADHDRHRIALGGIETALQALVGADVFAAWKADEDSHEMCVAASDNFMLSSLLDAHEEIATAIGAAARMNRLTSGRRTIRVTHGQGRLIQRVAEIWRDHVDADVSLPRREANPTSPLLRFIDGCLASVWGSNRPEPKAVLTFLADHVRPSLRGGVSPEIETPPSAP